MGKICLYVFIVAAAVVVCTSYPSNQLSNPARVRSKIRSIIQASKNNRAAKKNDGFEFLDTWLRVKKSKGAKKWFFLSRVNRILRPFVKYDRKLNSMINTLVEYIQDEVEEHGEQFFSILSRGDRGKTRIVFVYFKLREDGLYNFKYMIFRGEFKLAASLVITRSSKRNFFGSESRDVINYIPRKGITAEDIKDLLEVVVPQVSKVMSGFLPGDNSEG